MHPLVSHILGSIRAHSLAAPGGRVVAAVSGGADSVALLLLLREIAAAGHLELAGIAHFNHRLRGEAAEADERFCRELAERVGVPIDVGSEDVRALARQRRTSIENAARLARYAFLEAVGEARGAVIAVAHTRNDQAETVLLKLIRGAGLRGLAGIHWRRGRIVRPALAVGREELRAYLGEMEQAYREDETNRDLQNPRNRVRLELVPYLQRHFSPQVVRTLAREAEVAREAADWLDTESMRRASYVVQAGPSSVAIDVVRLAEQPPALASALVRQALQVLSGRRFIGSRHVDAVLDLAREGTRRGAAVALPGQRAVLEAGRVVLRPDERRRPGTAGPSNFFRYSLSVPGKAEIPEAGWVVLASGGDRPRAGDVMRASSDVVAVDVATVEPPLTVRSRRAGDRLKPLGLTGRKKVQDLFVDRKVPRDERDRVPLVVDARNRVVWVPGVTIGHDFRVTEATVAVIILERKRLGGVR